MLLRFLMNRILKTFVFRSLNKYKTRKNDSEIVITENHYFLDPPVAFKSYFKIWKYFNNSHFTDRKTNTRLFTELV